jgi:hypothetical protein
MKHFIALRRYDSMLRTSCPYFQFVFLFSWGAWRRNRVIENGLSRESFGIRFGSKLYVSMSFDV